jgi:glycosyltransferase involved in cell wall biosynthesis
LAAKRLTLVAASLGPGGTERVLAAMANHWVAAGRSVRLVTLSASSGDFYPLDPRVERVALDLLQASSGMMSALRINFLRVARMRQAILAGSPDAVISFGDSTNCLTLLGAVGTRLRVIVSERSDPRRLPIVRSWATLRRRLYPRAAAVVVQTQRVAPWAREFVPPNRVHVIPNFVAAPRAKAARADVPNGSRQVAAIGRLQNEKGFDLLLQAFARCAARHREWSLVIAGEGPCRRELEVQAAEAGLSERVHFAGLVRDIDTLLVRSDLFVLSSRIEGFPNALLEAMSIGVAPVAFDCDSGPAEIIRPGVDGVLVPAKDVDALARELDRLMGDDEERRRLAREAEAVSLRFGLAEVMQRWERIADEC